MHSAQRLQHYLQSLRRIHDGEAVTRDDEHDLSLTFSAGDEFKHYGDRLYQYAAAKRLNLV